MQGTAILNSREQSMSIVARSLDPRSTYSSYFAAQESKFVLAQR